MSIRRRDRKAGAKTRARTKTVKTRRASRKTRGRARR